MDVSVVQQIHRDNGAAKTRILRGAAGETKKRVLEFLAKDPAHSGEIREEFNFTYGQVELLMRGLVKTREVIIIGLAEQAGKTGVRRDAKIYALPGTEMLPQMDRRPSRSGSRRGSGVIAGRIEIGRGFKWGAGLA